MVATVTVFDDKYRVRPCTRSRSFWGVVMVIRAQRKNAAGSWVDCKVQKRPENRSKLDKACRRVKLCVNVEGSISIFRCPCARSPGISANGDLHSCADDRARKKHFDDPLGDSQGWFERWGRNFHSLEGDGTANRTTNTMPERMQAVIIAKGGPARYLLVFRPAT